MLNDSNMRFFSTLFAVIFCVATSAAQDYEIYVSDAGNFNNPPWQILKFDSEGDNPQVFIDSELAWPQDILFLEDQNEVLISNLNTNVINRHHLDNGEYIGAFASGMSGPTRMKIGADGYLYVLQWSGDGLVKRYELDGTFVDDFTSVGVSQSIGLDWDSDGNLYVSSYGSDLVHKFGLNGEDLGIFIDTNLLGPTNIWFDFNGDLLVSDYNGTAVKRFDSDGNYLNDFLAGLSNSEGVAFLPTTEILIGNGATSSVKMFDSDGNYLEDIVPSGSGDLLTPNAVVLGPLFFDNVDEHPSDQQSIVFPTAGSSFQFDFEIQRSQSPVFVYNLSGVFMDQVTPGFGYWTPNELADGTYILKTQNVTGAAITQRILIRR